MKQNMVDEWMDRWVCVKEPTAVVWVKEPAKQMYSQSTQAEDPLWYARAVTWQLSDHHRLFHLKFFG